jgi:hypothetical protein
LKQVGSIVNDGAGTSFYTNCRYVEVDDGYGHCYELDDEAKQELRHVAKRIFVKTVTSASIGQEITVNYGNEFFDHHPMEEVEEMVCWCVCVCGCV